MNSSPERLGFLALDLRCLVADSTAGKRHSRINVLFPEPLTPVTTTKRLSGKRTVRFLRLCTDAFRSVSQAFFSPCETGLRCPRVGKLFFARRHWPVMESG